MAQSAVTSGRTNIRHACQTFAVSETCFRYQAKASEENARIADWLVRLTTAHRDWGFGLCYLYLRNVERLWLEPQADLPDLPRVGVEPADQAEEAAGA
ncbi:hypothetical protein XACJK2_350003 [Xanthomonas citri pv. citri]|nr:hypothetical protein XACJK2_350003 [Xanthomonas citri pv. citri]